MTGASGYLASRLIPKLQGEVHALVRFDSNTELLEASTGVSVWRSDGSVESIEQILRQTEPTSVFHLATSYERSDSSADIPAMIDANITYGTTLLRALTQVNQPTFVYTGSYFEHAYGGDVPLNLYAATKRAFSEIVRYHEHAEGLRSTRVVMYEIYGPSDPRSKIVNAVINAAKTGSVLSLPSSDPKLDLVYVDDAADALIAAARFVDNSSAPSGADFSATSGELVPISKLVDLVESLSGRTIASQVGSYPTPTRTIEHPWRTNTPPGWTPQIDLSQGLADTLKGWPDVH